MNYREELAQLILSALKVIAPEGNRTLSDITGAIEIPKDTKLGDYAFPAFPMAKEFRLPPQEISKRILETLTPLLSSSSLVESVSTVGGFVNFFLKKDVVASHLLPDILEGKFLQKRPITSKVLVEYGQLNTHKAVHVGHLRALSLGDSIWRIFDWIGSEAIPVNYIGDEGTHVATCIWYYIKHFKGEIPDDNRGELLGNMYSLAKEMLNLSSLTRAPYPGVVAVKVVENHPHHSKKNLTVVKVLTTEGEINVVTGAQGFKVNDIVAYAKPGTKLPGKTVGINSFDGIESIGMVCAEDEIGLGTDTKNIVVLPPTVDIGTEVAEIFGFDKGHSVLQEFEKRKAEVAEVLRKLEHGDPEMKQIWKETKDWSMTDLYKAFDWLNCRFDKYYCESDTTQLAHDVIEEYQPKGVFIKSDGAIGADLKEWKLGFCILRKSDGNITYAARDLGLAQLKAKDYHADKYIFVVDEGQTLHFQQVFKCLELINFEHADDCHHVAYGIVTRPDGKMSSRKGNTILFSELQRLLLNKIRTEFLDKYKSEWSEEEINESAYRIALATIRYGMLNQDNNSVIVFDLDEWTARSGNTGPYMLYAYARIQSILRDFGSLDIARADWKLLKEEAETDLLMFLTSYPDVIEKAAKNFAPNGICTYLYELSKRFSRFYHDCPVLKAEPQGLKEARAILVKSVAKVLDHGLSLLGIKTVDRM